MLIIIDYDETFTEDKQLWSEFIARAKAKGHAVICCTWRVGNEYVDSDVIKDMASIDVEVVFSARFKDKYDAVLNAGYEPSNAIWIDDSPELICINREVNND